MSVLRADRRGRVGLIAAFCFVVVTATALSLIIEFFQQWYPKRTVSQNDIIAETIGGFVGATLWLLVGQPLLDWIRTYTRSRHDNDQINWLLQAYFLGLAIYSLLPLDLTINPHDIGEKLRDGRIVLLPFSDWHFGFSMFYELVTDVAAFIPVGMLLAIAYLPVGQTLRSVRHCLALGAVLVVLLELAQVIVYSRTASATDLIMCMVGVLIGVHVMHRWPGQLVAERPVALAKQSKRQWIIAGLVAAYSLMLIAVFCAPGVEPVLNLEENKDEIRARVEGFIQVPFAGLYTGSEFNAVSDVGRKMLFFAVLGVLLGVLAIPEDWPAAIRLSVRVILILYAAAVGMAIELVQVFVMPHVPDLTDVVLYSAGAAIGMFVTVRIRANMTRTAQDEPTIA